MKRIIVTVIVLGILLIVALSSLDRGLALEDMSPDIPEIELGQPGTSFRYMQTFGTTEEPYLVDTTHINRPMGLHMDGADNLFVVEEQGYRMLKYSNTGNQLLALGIAGVCYTDDYVLCAPQDVVTDSSANIWMADGNRVVQYDSGGGFLQQFPVDSPWESGSDNSRFNSTKGIALDSADHLFVSDSENHRIQVFDLSSGSPVYSATIGMSGTSGSGSSYFDRPHRIAVDDNDDLFVADTGNNRAQKCTFSVGWSCSSIDTGLNEPQGMATDGTDVYIADTANGRIRKCPSGGSCSNFTSGYRWLYDVAVDSSGNVYGAAAYEAVVLKYNAAGTPFGSFVGVEHVPYLTDGQHFNVPRVDIDNDNNIIIVEERGQRLIKLDPQGTPLWSVGSPGYDAEDNDHFSYPHGVATDSNNNIYVADRWRVQIFNASGIYQDTLGTGHGSGDYQFEWLTGITVDKNGNIYVSDAGNHRIQIYNSNLVFLGRIGATGVCGSAKDRLCRPVGLEVDSAGNIYVADAGNARVQKFNSNLQWQMTLGTVGSWGSSFSEFESPEDIAIDDQGRIYVADIYNDRVQVFTNSGGYLTTIGGSWGAASSRFRQVSGVDLDSFGNVYVSDLNNARIQKFAEGLPDWEQVNINGFGDKRNGFVSALEPFNGQLYAGTSTWEAEGGQIWRSTDGQSWIAVSEPGFSPVYSNTNPAIIDMIEFENQLYASTGWDDIPGQIWRSPNGTTWTQVVEDGFGNENNTAVAQFVIFKDLLYASTDNFSSGAEIWRSPTGNSASWESVVVGGNGNANNNLVVSFAVLDGYLYAGSINVSDGAEIWRTSDGTTWTKANENGFGYANNRVVGTLVPYNGMLYAGTENEINGGEIWRSANGTTWTRFAQGGIDDANNEAINSLLVLTGKLYAAASNYEDGIKVWQLIEDDTFSQINLNGFGDSNNENTLWNGANAVFKDQLYMGTINWANGGEVWRYDPQQRVYLPVVLGE